MNTLGLERFADRCSGCGYHPRTQGCACVGTLRFSPAASRVREEVRAMPAAGNAAPVLSGDAAVLTPTSLKDRYQSAALAAHPTERSRVEAAIRQLAATGRPFSANDARAIHGATGGVVGATFTALRKEGVIRAVGDETSTKGSTHGHRIFMWQGAAA